MSAYKRFPSQNFRLILSCLLVVSFSLSLPAATDSEIEELRKMVLELRGEVESLKQQLADKEASRDVVVPKPEKDSDVRKPLAKPSVAGVSSKYGLSFYGYFKLDAFYDSGLLSHQEIPFWVRPETSTNQGSFDMTAKETRLGMNFAGPEVLGGKLSGKLEMDFYGNINTPASLSSNHAFEPRSRHAYLNWDHGDWSLLAGKTWEPYLIIFPQTLNFTYNNFIGQLGLRKTQLRLTRKVGDSMEFTGAIIEPVGGIHGADVDGDQQDDQTDAEFPVVSGKMLYKFGKGGVMGTSFVFGKEQIDLHPYGAPKTYDAWAVSAAMSLPISERLTWKTSVYTGANVDSFWGGIGQGINLGLRTEIASQGGWTELQLKPSPKWVVNLGYAVDDPDDDDLGIGGRSKNETLRINSFYNFHPSLVWGLEYLNMETEYKGVGSAENDRVMSSIIYKF
jgi:hypothetical protein